MLSRLAALLAVLLFGFAQSGASQAQTARPPDAVRVFVPVFDGEDAVARAFSRTLYFELVKAFANPVSSERGAWILYGQETLPYLSHRSAVEEALYPSVRADLVFWGSVVRLADAYLVEPRLTRSPLSARRDPQPDRLEARFSLNGEVIDLSIANSSAYFDLEPFRMSDDVVSAQVDFRTGMPIYATPDSPEPERHWDGVVYFRTIDQQVARIAYDGDKSGWLRFPRIPARDLRMIDFTRGLIQVLRGDWTNAVESLSTLTDADDLPNALRIDANIYLGIAREKLGRSGLGEFRRAWSLNPLDFDAARFLLLALLRDGIGKGALSSEFHDVFSRSSVVFPENDPWLERVSELAESLSKQ